MSDGTGLTADPSALVWSALGRRFGLCRALVLAHVTQAVGMALPSVSSSAGAALVGAALFGGTFIGIVTLARQQPGIGRARAAAIAAAFELGRRGAWSPRGYMISRPALRFTSSRSFACSARVGFHRFMCSRRPSPRGRLRDRSDLHPAREPRYVCGGDPAGALRWRVPASL